MTNLNSPNLVDVAVIGAGMFGAEIALRARSKGWKVHLFEAKNDILCGASANNQNRLHLGFHYPRDLETGRQSIRGFASFSEKYGECTESSFPNAYFVADDGSLTSPVEFLEFCKRLGAKYVPIRPQDLPIDLKGASTGVLCHESVYDFGVLRNTVKENLRTARIPVSLGTRVTDICKVGNHFRLQLDGGSSILANAVVNATYGDINRLTEQLGIAVTERQFEYTVVPIIRVDIPKVGVTIMDGPFVTLLPYGKSADFLLYSVEHTVVAREISTQMDPSWLQPETGPFASMDKTELANRTLSVAARYLPILEKAQVIGFLEGPRVVLARHESTDARPSIINDYENGYHTVFAGKIDHCVWVAEELSVRLDRELEKKATKEEVLCKPL